MDRHGDAVALFGSYRFHLPSRSAKTRWPHIHILEQGSPPVVVDLLDRFRTLDAAANVTDAPPSARYVWRTDLSDRQHQK